MSAVAYTLLFQAIRHERLYGEDPGSRCSQEISDENRWSRRADDSKSCMLHSVLSDPLHVYVDLFPKYDLKPQRERAVIGNFFAITNILTAAGDQLKAHWKVRKAYHIYKGTSTA